MEIKTFFEDGRIQVNTIAGSDSTSDPFKSERDSKAATICTEVVVRADQLFTEGLCLDYIWYGTVVDSSTEKFSDPELYSKSLHVAGREPGRRVVLVEPTEMAQVVRITIDGLGICWREGGVLFNGIKYTVAQDTYCRKDSSSQAENAVQLHSIFSMLYPEMSDAEICDQFGYTPEMYERALLVANAGRDADDSLDAHLGDTLYSPTLSLPSVENPPARSENASVDSNETPLSISTPPTPSDPLASLGLLD